MHHPSNGYSAGEVRAFYFRNYIPIGDWVTRRRKSGEHYQYLGTTRQYVCRFCGRDKSQTTFRNVAHAIAEFLGNDLLVSQFECDQCNSRFATYEDDLARYLDLTRTLAGIVGKKSVLHFKDKWAKGEVRSANKESHLTFAFEANAPHISVAPLEQKIRFRWFRRPYHPLGLYKALVKFGLTLIPESELRHFGTALRWLRNPLVQVDDLDACHARLLYGQTHEPISTSRIILLRRKTEDRSLPYMLLFFQCSTEVFLTFLPTSTMDDQFLNVAWHPDFGRFKSCLDWRSPLAVPGELVVSVMRYEEQLMASELLEKTWIPIEY